MSPCCSFSLRATRSLCLPESQAATARWGYGELLGAPAATQDPWVPLGACLGWGCWGLLGWALCLWHVCGWRTPGATHGQCSVGCCTPTGLCVVCLRSMQLCPMSAPRGMSSLLDFVESHRVIESLQLEKTPNIIKSNRQPIPTLPLSHVPKCHISTSCAGRALCARCVVHTRCAVQLPALHSWERVSVCRGACIHKGVRPGRSGASSGAAERSGGGSGAWQVGSCRQERGSRMPGSRWCEQPVRAKRPGLGWPGGRRGEGRQRLPVRTRSPRLDRARCRSPGETPAARPGSVPAGCFGAAVVPSLSTKFVPEQSKRGTCTDGETEAFFAGNSSDSSRMSSPLKKKESSNRQLLLSSVCSRLSRTRRVRSPHPITAAISPPVSSRPPCRSLAAGSGRAAPRVPSGTRCRPTDGQCRSCCCSQPFSLPVHS